MYLTDTRIRSAKKAEAPYKLADAKGLYLEVRPTGAKLWRYRYRIDGKENLFALGEYCKLPPGETPEEAKQRRASDRFTLEEAREERIRARELVKQGIHPARHRDLSRSRRQADRANSFKAIALEWIDRKRKNWSSDYYASVIRTLELHVFPEIGTTPIKQLTTRRFRELLEKLDGKAVTAINVRQWCSAVFNFAILTERAESDATAPLKGHIERPSVKHKTPLTKDGIAALVKKIEASGYLTSRMALKLLLLTFVRPGELRRAEWTEFDLERGVWSIPAEKMKKRETHLVPLSTQTIELLRALRMITGHRRYLFPNQRNPRECMGENTLNESLRRLGYENQFSAHGFRATASTELHEMGFRPDIIEFQLAHAERDQTKASYNFAQFWNERKSMMQQWADTIDAWTCEDASKVVSIKAA